MLCAAANGYEADAVRRRRLPVAVITPAYGPAVTADRARVIETAADRRERRTGNAPVCRRLDGKARSPTVGSVVHRTKAADMLVAAADR